MNWTRKVPTKAGLYWFRDKNGTVDVARNVGREWQFINTTEVCSPEEIKGYQFKPCMESE